MSLNFCPIASGSSGNSIYVGTENTHILIDAGLSGKRIESGLKTLNLEGSSISALFITHEHSDHIQGAGIISRRFNIPVYTTEKTWRYIDRHNVLGNIDPNNKKTITPGKRCVINDLEIQPFQIPHDSVDPVGYCVFSDKHKISIATDIGHVTDTIKENLYGSSAMLLESNHDLEMLINGRYPQALKQRVSGLKGHLSNVSAGTLLVDIMSNHIKHIYLGHLSEENNRPIIAMDTICSILNANKITPGVDFTISLANRDCVSQMFSLE